MGGVVHARDVSRGQLRVALRGGQPFVAKQLLNSAQIGPFFEHMSAESVS